MKNIYFIVIILNLFFVSQLRASTGYEGFNLAPSFFFTSKSVDADGEGSKEIEETTSINSTRIGVTLKGGFYFGLLYESIKIDDGSDVFASKNYGTSIGITHNGSYMVFHFIHKANREQDIETEYRGAGSGFDFGHQFQLNSYLSIGIQLSHRAYKFDEGKIKNKDVDIDVESYATVPMVSLGLTF